MIFGNELNQSEGIIKGRKKRRGKGHRKKAGNEKAEG